MQGAGLVSKPGSRSDHSKHVAVKKQLNDSPEPTQTQHLPLAFQPTTGSQAVSLQQQSSEAHARSGSGFSLDFSSVPLRPPEQRDAAAQTPVHTEPTAMFIQPKLQVGATDDPLEREADRVSDLVMRMADPDVSVTSGSPQVNRKCAACRKEDENSQKLQIKPAAPTKALAVEAPAIVHDVLRSPGQPLDPATRAFFEPRFRYDFSHVVVHKDPRSAESAKSLHALAYSVGRHVVLDPYQYQTAFHSGRKLLGHELAHVIQGRCSAGILRRQPENAPTFGSLSPRQPDTNLVKETVELKKISGRWTEIDQDGNHRTATGRYAFAFRNDRLYGSRFGHLEASGGQRVRFAGDIQFSNGILTDWDAGSGSYKPAEFFAEEFATLAKKAGLDLEYDKDPKKSKFRPLSAEGKSGQRQLPVFQPESGASSGGPTKPTSPSSSAATQPTQPSATPGSLPTTTAAPTGSPPARTAPVGEPGKAPPMVGSQRQRIYGAAPSRPIGLPPSPRVARGAAVMVLSAAMAEVEEIGKGLQDKEARTNLLAKRQEIIDVLQNEPDVGAVIELQFLEPEHLFVDVFWHRTTDRDAGKPTRVAIQAARQPNSRFIYVEPVRQSKPGEATAAAAAPKEVKNAEEFIATYMRARGVDFAGVGTIAVEMYDALQRGTDQFGFTDVRAGIEIIRVSDAVRASIEPAVASLAEKLARSRLAKLKGGIDTQQTRLSEKMKDWLGGAIKLTGHELDRARAHYAAAENYIKDKKFGPATESINSGESQVDEVWAALYEYEHGRRPIAGPF